jgi:uncharacterized protein with PQ loop repeat
MGNMEITAIVAVLTAAISIAVKVVGFPDQIRSNYRRKSTAGLSSWFIVTAFISYILWTVHGFQVHDKALIIGQGLGVLTTGVIVVQLVVYRKPKSSKLPAERWVAVGEYLVKKHSSHTQGGADAAAER